jgi:carbamoyl-phosphate synthase large subunit
MTSAPRKVIILGSSALKIGEAGEFDYSGSQAIKALKDSGVDTVLVNPNIATIQTSDHLATKVYFLPVTPQFVERIIRKEQPDGILLSFGGQTALNCGLELATSGALERHGVRVLGTSIEAITDTEDRGRFVERLKEVSVKTPKSVAVDDVDGALAAAAEIGYPVMIRIAFALGGLGSGPCTSGAELRERAKKALSYTNQILVEEYLEGWKEIEYEVVRDNYDNCITVCNMENLDPLGIHTGESIVVAPSQTLNNAEYHSLRAISQRVVRHIGIVGECNIQFAIDPETGDYRVIEVNPRLSRSSALASKATGYPLAFVAAKVALGYGLTELTNSISKTTSACFEPALDYVAVKIPRWDLKKFRMVSPRIGSAMKSVGEVMAIGRCFEEALQKALRMLDIGVRGLTGNDNMIISDPEGELRNPTDERIFAIEKAFKVGLTVEKIHELTHIDPWFLHKLRNIVGIECLLKTYAHGACPKKVLLTAKRAGFSDDQIGRALRCEESDVRAMRRQHGLSPAVKQIDTLAAECPAQTNYLYLTYNGDRDDVNCTDRPAVLVLGSGVYRIGSSVEFDWCCVNTVMKLRKMGYQTILVNCNPETVSTDYDECDRLYFDELSFEAILDIYEKERPIGVIISMGGQIPNNLATRLHEAGLNVLGTSAENIDRAENRHRFSRLLDSLGIDQPAWNELASREEAIQFARAVSYPVLVRPSHVLSGAAMSVASTDKELLRFLDRAEEISRHYPVVISKFIENAKEIEFDGVADKGALVVSAISEHVENAGVHSGDATLVLPPQRTYLETLRRVRSISRTIARALKITGPFNIQYIAKNNDVKVIECNLRASRSFPFVSKVSKVNFIEIATSVLLGEPVKNGFPSCLDLEHVGVKAPQFSFTRLCGADPTLGVEMASTGEVGCLGDNFEEAFLKALISVGFRVPVRSVLLSSGPLEGKAEFIPSARLLQDLGVKIYCTEGTARFMEQYSIPSDVLHWPLEAVEPNVLDYLRNRRIDLVVNIPKNYQEVELTNDYIIRRTAVDFGIPLITNLQLAKRLAEALHRIRPEDLAIKSWDEY